MSNESTRLMATRFGSTISTRVSRFLDYLSMHRRRWVILSGAGALVAVASVAVLRVGRNLPFDPVGVPSGVFGVATQLMVLAVGLALIVVGLSARPESIRVGLLFAGVFALLATASRAAWLPGFVAVIGGGGMALAGVTGLPSSTDDYRRTGVAGLLLMGTAMSLASTAGLVATSFRGFGSLFVLLGIAGIGVRAQGDWIALTAGGLAAGSLVVAGISHPFLVGSALLAGFAIAGVSYLVVALALGGAVAAIAAGLRRRHVGLAIGGFVLLGAGVPATLPRATAVILGATLAVGSVDRVVGRRSTTQSGAEASS